MAQGLSAEQKLSPMMEQYRSMKKTLPEETILFFRLGDFYEMFFEDAVRGSEILNITLTGREGGPIGRVPMCGIPYHAFQQYVRILLDKNLKVAICEQIGDPKESKGLVERRITRIISPATYLDEDSKAASAEYLAAVVSDGRTAALAALDLGTGEFFVRQVPQDRLLHELTLLHPREVVLPKGFAEKQPLASFLKENLKAAVTVYENWIFDSGEGLQLLKNRFGLASERSIPFNGRPLAVGAAGALLYYLKDHLHSALDHLRLPQLLEANEFMTLDRQTLKNLELLANVSGETPSGNLLACLDQTLTPMGTRTLCHWVTHPLLSLEGIRRRQEGVAELSENLGAMQELRASLQGIRDIERTLSRLNVGVANARDLLQLKFFLERLPAIGSRLAASRSGILQDVLKEIHPSPELTDLIAQAIVEAPPVGLKDGGLIRDGYSKELEDLRRLSSQGKSWLMEFERREIARTGIKSLRIRYSQVFGYSLEVSKANLHAVPKDYIRKQTLVNAERFVVPELQRWDEQISGAEEKIKALEFRIFGEIRAAVLERLSPLQETARALGTVDAGLSLALSAVQKRWVRPEMEESKEISIVGGRHPVVEAMLPAGQFVENDATLNGTDHQLIVLTGPNMAGKSTYIRQVAQIVLLAQIGSFVPARSAKIGLVDRIFTRIGASDDLARGESTFMVEMIEMAQILQMATERSLLILDEVGRGTSTFDGVSLAWAICEHLMQGAARPRTLFATHYHELIQLESQFPACANYTITVRETPEGIVFLRTIVRGGSDRSYGIHVARLAGIPREVTERAGRILQVLESENRQATQIIEGKAASFPPFELPQGKLQRESDPRWSLSRAKSRDEDDATTHPILEEIRALSFDHLTPLEALNKLAAWKSEILRSAKRSSG